MEETQDVSKQIDFNNLTYHYKSKNGPKNFLGFKLPLNLYRTITEGYIILEKAEEHKKTLNRI